MIKKKLKLLFVAQDKYPPSRVDVSVLFHEKMISRGHKIDWLLQSEETIERSSVVKWGKSNVYLGKTDNGESFGSRLKKNIFRFLNDTRLLNLVKKNNYDFIIIKDVFFAALLAIIASRLYKVRLIYWLSYPFPEAYYLAAKEGTARYPFFYLIRSYVTKFLLYNIILKGYDHTFVQSEQMKKDIAAEGIAAEKMTSVPMGVSINSIPFFGYNRKKVVENNEKIILYLGTLDRTRRLEFVIRAFSLMLKQFRNARLIFVGGGEDASDELFLKNEAKTLGLEDSISFTGKLPQEEAWSYVKNSDVCVSPYYPTPILNSTSPTKMIEYMAMGKAVVANDHPEQGDVLSESKAGICVSYNEKAFADAILYLFNHPEEAQDMGIRGRKYVEQHRGYDRIADKVEAKLLRI